ncbi:hypothetical protein Q673_04860 [Marinobacter sp. EN3]|nr:hypothetical protein Q673_04860 [Marinobacter sp. EN3]
MISDWTALTALVVSFIAYLEAKKMNKTGEAVQALCSVIDASEKTQTYLQRRAEGAGRDRETEYELAQEWSRAAFIISRINKDLSVRLDQKSQFWRNPETWDAGKGKKVDISLESVKQDAKRLMDSYA